MFSAIGNFFGKMLGTDRAVEGVISNASKALDKLVYTSEEKAEDRARDVSEARKMIIEWMRNTQGQNLARRLIALAVTFVWLLQYIIAQVMSVASVWVENPNQYTQSAQIIGDYAEAMIGAMMLILGFYFAAPHLGDLVKGAMAKFTKRPER